MAKSFVCVDLDEPLADDETSDETATTDETDRASVNFVKSIKSRNVETIIGLIKKHCWLVSTKLPPSYGETFLSPKILKKRFSSQQRQLILDKCSELFQNQPEELMFFAAAKLNVDQLRQAVATIKNCKNFEKAINQARDGNNILFFLLKLSDPADDNFLKCLEILVENKVNANKCDGNGQKPIDYIVASYKATGRNSNKIAVVRERLKDAAVLLLNSGIGEIKTAATIAGLSIDMGLDLTKFQYVAVDSQTRLFNLVINQDQNQICRFRGIKKYANIDDGENTLLQLVVLKFQKCPEILRFLLKNHSDPNRKTKINPLTPLELAALMNCHETFLELLSNKTTEVTEAQFNTFVKWRGVRTKTKYFKELLESDKLQTSYRAKKSLNTPLHYALIFSHKKAILNQLTLGSSLLTKNAFGKCALDIVQPEDLESYFNNCMPMDNYSLLHHCSTEASYKIHLNFAGFLNHDEYNETEIVYKIGKRPRLQHLLKHVLVQMFIYLKWYRVKEYFWTAVAFQICLYSTLFLAFYFFNTFWQILAAIFTVINVTVKYKLLVLNKQHLFKQNNKIKNVPISKIVSTIWEQFDAHCFIEAFCSIIMLLTLLPLGNFQTQMRPFVFIAMTVSFLLTLGYHPKLSKWSLMLQKIFKTFSLLSLFFFLPMLAFGMGFNVLFQHHENQELFHGFLTSIFRTYIMITGEFEVNSTKFDNVGSYLLFLLFAIGMTMILINFWTGVAVTDIGKIEENSEVNALKNIVVFLKVVETNIYRKHVNLFKKFEKTFGSPFLFRKTHEENCGKFKKPYTLDFFINRKKRFRQEDLPEDFDDEIVNKLKKFVYSNRRPEVGEELEDIKKQLEKLNKGMTEKIEETTAQLKGELEKIKQQLKNHKGEISKGLIEIIPSAGRLESES